MRITLSKDAYEDLRTILVDMGVKDEAVNIVGDAAVPRRQRAVARELTKVFRL